MRSEGEEGKMTSAKTSTTLRRSMLNPVKETISEGAASTGDADGGEDIGVTSGGMDTPLMHDLGTERSADISTLCAGLLEGDERIMLAFTTGQDSTDVMCFTTKRALVIDRQESGPYEMVNIPWTTVRNFTVLASDAAE